LRATLDFLLHDWLGVASLLARERFADHSAETFASVLDTCERIAREKFAPFNRLADTEEPHFDGERVHLPQATHDALAAYVQSGMLAAAQDYDVGGMQLPCVIEMAANAFFSKASVGMGGYAMLTSGNASLLMAHGTPAQREVFAKAEFSGRWFGTMCLSEPQAGSSLSDVATRAEPDGADFEADPLGPRYRLRGNKMWISAGEHELTENIVHLVLAKIPGPDGKLVPGTRGISLFIVPKHLVDAEAADRRAQRRGAGRPEPQAGLPRHHQHAAELRRRPIPGARRGRRHRLPRGRTGRGPALHVPHDERGAHRRRPGRGDAGLCRLRGQPGLRPPAPAGPAHHRCGQGRGAAAGAAHPARRHQAHAAGAEGLCEGGLALELYCARLVDEQHTGEPAAAAEAGTLLDVLTPIAKSWPSEWCLEANSLAIQVLGGYGYTRDFGSSSTGATTA
jgi:alkylation response protein AidB-like acyl-CoA dehydrogenase